MPDLTKLPQIDITVQSGIHAVREILSQLMDKLSPLGLEVEEAGTVELVLAEALNNIVEHGYPDKGGGGPIRLSCVYREDGLRIRLIDKGVPMPNGETPLGLAANLDVDFMDTPEGGFGWFIIKDLAKDVEYRRVDGCNVLDLKILVGAASNK